MKIQDLTQLHDKLISHASLCKIVYEMYFVDLVSIPLICSKTVASRSRIYQILNSFASDNPQILEQMKKTGKDLTPEDYNELKKEISKLKSELSKEKLRADFYEEMVAFGKEIYGIDFKKAGTK